LFIAVLSLLSGFAVRRAIAPTAPGCGTLGRVLDVEWGRKGFLAGELNGMRAHPPSRSTPRRAPTFNADKYYPRKINGGAKWIGGYIFSRETTPDSEVTAHVAGRNGKTGIFV
jgi:hypothetical protein